MEDAAVLDIGAGADADVVHVAADYGAGPDAGVGPDDDVADDDGGGVNIGGGSDFGPLAAVGPYIGLSTQWCGAALPENEERGVLPPPPRFFVSVDSKRVQVSLESTLVQVLILNDLEDPPRHRHSVQRGQPKMAVPLKAAGLRRLRPAVQVLLVKRKMRQLGCRTTSLYVDMPEGDCSKIRFTLKGKESSQKWLLHFWI